MADLTKVGKNNQKKTYSVFASEYITTSATMDDTLFSLPAGALVTGCYVYVATASGGDATDTVDIKVGNTVIVNELVVGTTGTKTAVVTPTYFPTGGVVTVVAGADAPGTAGSIKVIVEYIETALTNGQYTN